MQPVIMRRQRRHRWLTYSVLVITYSIFQAVMSANIATKTSTTEHESPAEEQKATTILSAGLEEEHKGETKSTEESVGPVKNVEDAEEDDDAEKQSKTDLKGKEEPEEGLKKLQKDANFNRSEILLEEENLNQYRKKRNCTPPAIEQFPRPVMGPYARRHGGLILHVLVAVFTFIGLAIVCDEYFVSSLDRICEELQLAPDVAGATFMAAGSSAPELATVVIGVFCARDDIGVSGVIGSAVFNIMFVISVCALCAGTVSHLNWWPLCRDCFFYAVSILVMLCTIANGQVTWPEALFMLIMYGVYCVALKFNTALERWALTFNLPFKLPTREEQAALVTYRSAGAATTATAPGARGDSEYTQMDGATKETPMQNAPYQSDGTYENAGYNSEAAQSWDTNQSWNPDQAWAEDTQGGGGTGTGGGWDSSYSGWNPGQQQPASKPPEQQSQSQSTPISPQPVPQNTKPPVPAYYKAKEYNPETAVNPLVKPVGANPVQLACFYVAFPIHWSCRHTMPDCRGKWYPVTFIISMLWISFYSYIMVWMITIIGSTLSIPDTVMGLTFVAAGVSVPDALSSLAVIKEGYGDMAVSNAVGSNVFDILVCLGLPWFIQTAIIMPGSHVNVISKGLIYSTMSLLSTVVFLVVATHANGWKLDRKYGIVLMIWYLLFITFASLYELNVFGNFHPPDCGSEY